METKILDSHSVKTLAADEMNGKLGTIPKGAKGMMNHEIVAWRDWLTSHNWTFFTTFTTGYEASVNAVRRMNGRFFESLMKHKPNGLTYFWVAERHKHRGYHTHGLLNYSGLTSEGNSSEITAAWRIVIEEFQKSAGKLDDFPFHRNKVAVFDNKLGAADYCIKYLNKDVNDWDFLCDSVSSRC